jgi:hypothetical protein
VSDFQPIKAAPHREKGKLYRWNGVDFEEVVFDDAGHKVPVTDEAIEVVKSVRKAVQASLGMRPELSLVASAMLLQAGKDLEIVSIVKQYGSQIYSKVG